MTDNSGSLDLDGQCQHRTTPGLLCDSVTKSARWALTGIAQFTGRVIAALYASEERMPLPGQALIGAELAERLGVLDIDGRQPPSHRRTLGAPHELHETLRP